MLRFKSFRDAIISSSNFENILKSSRTAIAERTCLAVSLSSSLSSSSSSSSSWVPVISAIMPAVVRSPWDVLTSILKSMKSLVDIVGSISSGNFRFIYESSASRVWIVIFVDGFFGIPLRNSGFSPHVNINHFKLSNAIEEIFEILHHALQENSSYGVKKS